MNTRASKNQKAPPNKPANPSIWFLFFVACGCMFVLGVLVGRNTMPVRFDMEDLNKKLAGLQRSVLVENTGTPVAEQAVEQAPFEFYEKLTDDQDLVYSDDEEMPLRHIKPKFRKDVPVTAALTHTDPERESRRSWSNETRGAAAEPQPAPRQTATESAGSPDRGRGGFVIQVASLRDMENARAVSDKFKARGYPAYTQLSIVEGKGTWSRVRIGPYLDREQAMKDLDRLQNAGVDAILLSIGHE
jgi:cell division septation protein DedD